MWIATAIYQNIQSHIPELSNLEEETKLGIRQGSISDTEPGWRNLLSLLCAQSKWGEISFSSGYKKEINFAVWLFQKFQVTTSKMFKIQVFLNNKNKNCQHEVIKFMQCLLTSDAKSSVCLSYMKKNIRIKQTQNYNIACCFMWV